MVRPFNFNMIGALVILLFTTLVGVVIYLLELRWRRNNNANHDAAADASVETPADNDAESQQCCGQHLVCEKESLSPFTDEIIYYDDEELDRFVGRDPESYSAAETEEFRNILMTLLPVDVAGWARSITQRRIELPPDVRDELFIMVREQRAKKQEISI